MIIGSGLLATVMAPAFEKTTDTLIYAAGVSNSLCIDENEYKRDLNRLSDALKKYSQHYRFIYFSTCSIGDPDNFKTAYVQHKIAMEALVRELPVYIIVRLPQVAGKTPNPHTLLNFLYSRIVRGESFPIWINARRNIIDCDDVALIVQELVKDKIINNTINIANNINNSIIDIVSEFELILKKEAVFKPIAKGSSHLIDISHINTYIKSIGISFDDTYLKRTLLKYYGKT